MNFRQALLTSTLVLALGCGENSAPSGPYSRPLAKQEAVNTPATTQTVEAVTPETSVSQSPGRNTKTSTNISEPEINSGAVDGTEPVSTTVPNDGQRPDSVTATADNPASSGNQPSGNTTHVAASGHKAKPPSATPAKPEPQYATLSPADLQKLADEGDPQASWVLGLRFEAGNGVATNAVTAYQLITMAAVRSKGVHRSLILKDRERIKPMLTTVQVEQSAKPAGDFLTKQVEKQIADAAKGDAEMQYMLGVWFLHGEGVPSDKGKAVKLLAPAAEQGHVGASALLGRMHFHGDTVAKDMVKGYRLLEYAAQKGSEWARAELSEYQAQTMTPAQLAEASQTARTFLAKKVALLEAAAEKGAASEQFKLGLMYYLGTEIFKDLEKAAQWFQKAGEQGHADAPALLAGMHFSGEGLEKSFVQAYKWYSIAKGRGNTTATANQAEVTKLLTAEEKAASDKEVSAWLAAHPKK